MKRMQNPSIFAALLAASLLTQAPDQAAAATRPTLIITYPTANLSVTNSALTVSGKASDKAGVTNVFYQLNGSDWKPAHTANGWTNWTASVTLTNPGAYSVRAYAVDAGTNYSLTNAVKFTYAPTAPLMVQIVGLGTVSPNYNGKWLKIGAKYSMTATAGKGFGFLKWSGSLSTNKPTLSFVMAPDLTFIAKFVDMTPPVAVILSPKVHQSVSNAVFSVTGKASDLVGVTNVWYQLNGAAWTSADTTDGWTNWMAQVTLRPGTNLVAAYAENGAGLKSKTNSISFTYVAPPENAPASLSGMSAEISSTDETKAFTVSFGADTFSQSMLPGANEDDNVVGTYTYLKLSTTTALLTITDTAPPSKTNHTNKVMLTFTNSQNAVFISTNQDGSIGTGAAVLSSAPDLAPKSLAGDTADLVTSLGEKSTTVFGSDGAFSNTAVTAAGTIVSKGSYTFKQYSPVGGLLTIEFTSPTDIAGAVSYNIITYSASKAGTWFQAYVPPDGGETENDYGTFTVP